MRLVTYRIIGGGSYRSYANLTTIIKYGIILYSCLSTLKKGVSILIWSELSEEAHNNIIMGYLAGTSIEDLASRYGLKAGSLERKIRLLKERGDIKVEIKYNRINARLIIEKAQKVLVYADPHFGAEDELAVKAALVVIEEYQPDILINLGDSLEGSKVSRFRTPEGAMSAQYERDSWGEFCEKINHVAKPDLHIVLIGNHDNRYINAVRDIEGIAEINEFSLRHLLYADELDLVVADSLQVNPAGDELYPNAQMYFYHSMFARKGAGRSVQAMSEKLSYVNIAIGHAHRTAHTTQATDRGIVSMWEVGTLRNLDCDYDVFTNWSQSLLTGVIDPEYLDFQSVMIDRGRVIFNGAIYNMGRSGS